MLLCKAGTFFFSCSVLADDWCFTAASIPVGIRDAKVGLTLFVLAKVLVVPVANNNSKIKMRVKTGIQKLIMVKKHLLH